MENSFTISERTNKLLAIYRDFNRVANELWQYFKPEGQQRGLSDPDEVAERNFKPFSQSINDINEKLLARISTNIENAVVFGNFGDTKTQI